ncbi:hypothetical protein JKP88DRAFT_245749 [Tribonema minus]|uniref:Uncharacterized protein n=1 Tax=Tribonema minus TaxID=303371 RepID=A0A835YVT0_9STRA|nr:hypothetical protein JKP88DRAFT_245749 [Tribonema minus]
MEAERAGFNGFCDPRRNTARHIAQTLWRRRGIAHHRSDLSSRRQARTCTGRPARPIGTTPLVEQRERPTSTTAKQARAPRDLQAARLVCTRVTTSFGHIALLYVQLLVNGAQEGSGVGAVDAAAEPQGHARRTGGGAHALQRQQLAPHIVQQQQQQCTPQQQQQPPPQCESAVPSSKRRHSLCKPRRPVHTQ